MLKSDDERPVWEQFEKHWRQDARLLLVSWRGQGRCKLGYWKEEIAPGNYRRRLIVRSTSIQKKDIGNLNADGLSSMYTGPDSDKCGNWRKSGCRSKPIRKNKGFADTEKMEILKERHESPIGGYVGINRTFWKGYGISSIGTGWKITEFIQKCECQKNKMTQCHTRPPSPQYLRNAR
jgi:hypothetical protein